MGEDDKKFFDVSRPARVGPHPTSKPIIVGHRPSLPDPMLREDQAPEESTDVQVKHAEPKPDYVTPPSSAMSASSERAMLPTDEKHTPELPASSTNYDNLTPTSTMPSSDRRSAPNFPDPTLPPTALQPGSQLAPAGPENVSSGGAGQLHLPAGHNNYHHKPRLWVWLLVLVILLASIYAAVDAKSDILPFHIFSHDANTATPAANTQPSPTNQPNPTPSLPAGYTRYQVTGTPITFAYPTTWGKPTTTKDPGYTKRGADQKSDGVHAFLVDFAKNQSVEIAIGSYKYLPATRAALYYDYLQWCVGTNDNKIYKQQLRFTTADGVDTPTTVTCDQGPLADAHKLNKAVIVQEKTKDAGGAVLGNIYTANVSNANDLVVLRVKDTKMTNSNDIEKLINTIGGAPGTSH